MTWTRYWALGLGLGLFAASAAHSQVPSIPRMDGAGVPIVRVQNPPVNGEGTPPAADAGSADTTPSTPSAPEGLPETNPEETAPLGPTPLPQVNILNQLLYGDDFKDAKIKFSGWADFDYTFRSTGPGQNNVAPVMNRFGDEFLDRQEGIWIRKDLSKTDWDWGFNIIFIAGADAAFLTPTAGGWKNTDPRFGTSFTDLNLTAHLAILTEGGVDIKAGRQTTVLGPMGALPWQRTFDSSDYAWYNMEEGRYTGVSATWHINKQLDWYNGIEIGGWGTFFDDASHGVDYIGQVSYWLDEAAKKTKVWATVLTGPTGFHGNGNTTVVELGLLHNYNEHWYQIIDTQNVYSKQPIFPIVPPGYQERAYDVYTYLGYHVNKCLDINSRLEWYKDVDGGSYPGGFGVPHTTYMETTLGIDYHPTKWIQFRPEIRYDYASHPNFGPGNDKQNQLTLAADLLFKF